MNNYKVGDILHYKSQIVGECIEQVVDVKGGRFTVKIIENISIDFVDTTSLFRYKYPSKLHTISKEHMIKKEIKDWLSDES